MVVACWDRFLLAIKQLGLDAMVDTPVERFEFKGFEQRIRADIAPVESGQDGGEPCTQIEGGINSCCRDHGHTFYKGAAKSDEPPTVLARAYCRIF